MTTGTGAIDLSMVNLCYWRPGCRGMTSLTVVSGVNVSRVLAGGGGAVVAV